MSIRLIAAFVIVLIFIWRVRKGFDNGIMKEIVNILSGVISIICLLLVLFAIRSFESKATSTLVLSVGGLIILGVIFKICSLIFTPILAIGKISVIGWFNRLLGAILGACEAAVISILLYKVLYYFGIYII